VRGLTFTCKDKGLFVYKENILIFRATRSKIVWTITDVIESTHYSISNPDILYERLCHHGRFFTSGIPKAVSGICLTKNLQ
jgi:hypothetical protein